MKIVFYNRSLMSGGIEKCIEILSRYLQQKYELEIVYSNTDKLDEHIVQILSKYAKVTYLQDKIINCDICICCYLYFDYNQIMSQIHAKSYFCWIHSRPRALPNCLLDNDAFVDKVSEFICVSEEIKNSLGIKKQGIVIHNFINEDIKQLSSVDNPFQNCLPEELKLVIVSRLSTGKGFERVEKLVQALERKQVPYHLTIVGKGRAKEKEIRDNLSSYEGVEFVGYKDNPYCYVKNADYLVLLSDYESWGNVITEAKALDVPCLVTNFPSATEQITQNYNGIIVPMELENYDQIVEELISKKDILKNNLKTFSYHNEIEKWEEVIQRTKESSIEINENEI